jgi:CubicO group peptidase (beta-lactamase class C family)
MSEGYTWGGGSYASHKYEFVEPGPAGAVASSAADMAKFMIAHLNNGSYNGQRILSDSTALRMHTRAFGHDPRLPGFALGFYEKSSHGVRIIGHGGDTQWFHTDLALIPDEKLGVFVSYNTSTGGELSFSPFLTQFLDHYYATPRPRSRSRRCQQGSGARGRVRVQSTLIYDISEGNRPRRH